MVWFCADNSSHLLEHSVRSFRGWWWSTEKESLEERLSSGMEGRSLRLAEDQFGHGAENWTRSLIETSKNRIENLNSA